MKRQVGRIWTRQIFNTSELLCAPMKLRFVGAFVFFPSPLIVGWVNFVLYLSLLEGCPINARILRVMKTMLYHVNQVT